MCGRSLPPAIAKHLPFNAIEPSINSNNSNTAVERWINTSSIWAEPLRPDGNLSCPSRPRKKVVRLPTD